MSPVTISHTRRSNDPLCGLIVTHRRTGVTAARAAELAPRHTRQLLLDLSEVVLDAAGRVAIHARSEGIPVGDSLHLPVDAGGPDFDGLRSAVGLRLNDDLTHTELLASGLACPSCLPVIQRGHTALLPFVEPVRRKLGAAVAMRDVTVESAPGDRDVAGSARA